MKKNKSIIGLPGNKPYKSILNEMIRVDHAGEYAAKRIYEGQLLAVNEIGDINIISDTQIMLNEETEHLRFFESLLCDTRSRPSFLFALAGYIGFKSGYHITKVDYKKALLFTEAVETVIINHYQEQIDHLTRINKLTPSSDINHIILSLIKIQNEEEDHKNHALHIVNRSYIDNLMSSIISIITKLAVNIAKKI